MTPELIKQINAKYLVRFTDTTGKVKLIGAGRLPNYLGANGEDVAERIYNDVLDKDKDKHSIRLRGITVNLYTKLKFRQCKTEK